MYFKIHVEKKSFNKPHKKYPVKIHIGKLSSKNLHVKKNPQKSTFGGLMDQYHPFPSELPMDIEETRKNKKRTSHN